MLPGRFMFCLIIALSLIIFPAFGCAAPSGGESALKAAAEKVRAAAQSDLDKLDADVVAAAAKLKTTGLGGDQARQVLNDLFKKYPFLVDCCVADNTGKVVIMVPEAYRKYEGVNLETDSIKQPVFTRAFKAIEGITGVALMRPVLDEKGAQSGIIDVLLTPKALLNDTATSVTKDGKISINVAQPDGLTIFDLPSGDTGKNLLTDPEFQSYKELVAFAQRLAKEESGTGSYSYTSHKNDKTVTKQAAWYSVKLHGTAWRIVAVEDK